MESYKKYGKNTSVDKRGNNPRYVKYDKLCEQCGQPFVARRISTRFCSALCNKHNQLQRRLRECEQKEHEELVNNIRNSRLKYAQNLFFSVYNQRLPHNLANILRLYNRDDMWNYVVSQMVDSEVLVNVFCDVECSYISEQDSIVQFLMPDYTAQPKLKRFRFFRFLAEQYGLEPLSLSNGI